MTAIEMITSAFNEESLYNKPAPITPEEAATTLAAWKEEGFRCPPTITPLLFSRVWNILCEKHNGKMVPAIYVHESRAIPYASAIAAGYKTIETRSRDMLGAFLSQRVLIIRTRDGHPADIVGSAVIASKRFYSSQELDALRNKTGIPAGSKYDCHGRGKWGYTMTDAVLFSKPVLLSTYTIEHKTRSWALLSE